MAGTSEKCSRCDDDVPDTEPGDVVTESQDEQAPSPKIHCSQNLLSNKEMEDESKECKAGKKHRRSDDGEDDEESGPSSPKKRRIGQFFKNLGKEMVSAIKKMSSSTKEAFSNRSELAEEISKYTNEFSQDLVDAAEAVNAIPTSREMLQETEEYILKDIDSKGEVEDVVVEEDDGNKIIIHTVHYKAKSEEEESKFSLVMIHGYGGGLACFHKNFHGLCQKRDVYAIDVPGFALSSRIDFPDDPQECRDRIVELIEKWRVAMKLEKFILLGHSFGGYLAGSYTLKHEERVRHLILADSWGVLGKEEDKKRNLDPFKKAMILMNFNPFEFIRNSMAIGQYLHEKFVPKKIRDAYGDKLVPYFYHSNAQPNATGEKAFANISDDYLWPHVPLRQDLEDLDASVPITFLYGEDSDFKNDGGETIQKKRGKVFIPATLKAGHHIQAEDYDEFNKRVNDVFNKVDSDEDIKEHHQEQ